jgi:hypothetical protein
MKEVLRELHQRSEQIALLRSEPVLQSTVYLMASHHLEDFKQSLRPRSTMLDHWSAKYGLGERTRTSSLLVPNQVLCALELHQDTVSI